ncbi:tyrosine phosphatase (macronuclear) [Tetrahymena thermophila SB210]|uniref:Tyrosine phosphatase n=1 Tax=Tetrahymena thermophila (strain SB210) TaxID=312017 RepID=I7M1B3_TETTS|nr:tyrosine phosphatase [Tetrahymena thermophila SB210]EAR95995.2 tyrosine phosphatase [Tetrahymena thermophila SB210]|eukprot:XP_001016240.2 tyrosine phosphatase [Tetrahymena thermophila SB210]
MEQQVQENIDDQALQKEIDQIQLQPHEEIKSQEEQKENNQDSEQNPKQIKDELTQEQQKKKIERLHQCILAIVALKKMNTDHMPAKIIDYLYLGSIGAALKKDVIEKLNIKFILSAMDKSKPMFQDICTYKQLPILDSPDVDIQKYFDESSEFINQAVESQQNILVHCFAGKSRSTTLVLAYLMKYKKLALDEALNLVRQTREIAQPNSGFMKQLQMYEQNLKEKIQVQNEENKI